MLLSYDDSNLKLEEQTKLFPDHLENRDEVVSTTLRWMLSLHGQL